MAVAGLHNVPDFSRSFFGGSQKRASSLLQMWREIEGEHVLSPSYRSRRQRNGFDSECISTSTSVGDGSESGDAFSQVSDEFDNRGFGGSEISENCEDNHSVISEQSRDLGEIERERVRQIFQEWTNSSSKGRKGKNDIGNIETESVRILRERVQTTAQQRSECAPSRVGVAEVRSQICGRKPLRKLCGRQTLLDLLLKAQNERKKELLSLSEQRPVSDFAHRNRIQALLRGRFLRNGRVAVDEKPSSVAATELGFLRQRQTVSGLREGFLSKLDSSGSASANGTGPDYSNTDGNKCESESTSIDGGVTGNHISVDSEDTTADGNMHNMQELEVQIVEAEEHVLDNGGSQEDLPVCATIASSMGESALATEARQHEVLCHVEHEHINATFTNTTLLGSADCSNSSEGCSENNGSISGASSVYELVDHTIEVEGCSENNGSISGASSVYELVDHAIEVEGNTNEEFNSHDSLGQAESVTEVEESAEQNTHTVASERADGNSIEERDQMQESHVWPSHGLQEAIDSWLDMPSSEAGESVREVDTVYFPYDDDNDNSMELRELFSRRRVSNLLHSSFRESLDQVLQSHVERLGHASADWEVESASFPPIFEQDHEQINRDRSPSTSEGAERNPFTQSSTLFEASQQLWNEDFQVADWPRDFSNQHLETEWGVINELRADMARLQERMSDMQGMLEACLDMQIELQRSLHQEVSAAINRSNSAGDVAMDNGARDESKWDRVKRGICCLCQQNKIDSLLYRCGHMCTCTKCAETLVHSKGKCPLCCAPTVEAVRAYFVQ